MKNLKVALSVACAVVVGWAITASADISASAYVQDGLVVQYDGIDNAGTGTHDANAPTWKDLKGQGGDMPLGGLTSPVWDGKGLSFGACGIYNSTVTTEFLCTPNVLKLGDEFTIQMFCNTGDKYDCRRWDLVPYSYNYETWTSSSEGFLERVNNANRFSLKPWVSNADIIFTTVAGDKKHRFMIEPIGGTAQSVEGNLPSCVVNNRLAFMKTNGSNVPRKDCYSIRIYNRALTADEIALNAAVDKLRFADIEPEELGYRWNAETEKVECRVIVETEGSGTVKIGDGEWTTAATNWVEFASAPTCTISASPADGSAFICWKIGTGNPPEVSTAQPLERTISGPTVIRAVFRDEAAMKRWIYLPSAQSGGAGSAVISNAVSHTVLKVTVSGTNLTISGIFKNGDDLTDGAKTLDLSTPVESLDYVTQYAITTINGSALKSPFTKGAENLYLPETLTTLGGQMIDCWGGVSSLRRVRFPKNLTAIKSYGGTAGYQFRSCTNLLEVLPAGILESGQITDYTNGNNMFQNCQHFTNCINFSTVAKVPSAILLDCPSVAGRVDIGHVTSVGGQAFKNCGKLIFPDPLVMPNVTSIGSDAFNGTTVSNLDVTGAAITTLSLNGAAQLRTVKPKLYPDTVTATYMYGCKELLGDVTLPSGFASLGEQAFVDCQKITSLDLSRTTIRKFEGGRSSGATA